MFSFVGWSPTIAGRLSFSRIADITRQNRAIANTINHSGGFIFGWKERASRDGPFWPPIMRYAFGRVPTAYILFLEPHPAKLPFLDEENGKRTREEDDRGVLIGDVIAVSATRFGLRGQVVKALQGIRRLSIKARSCRDHQRALEYRDRAHRLASALWAHLKAHHAAGLTTPAFARSSVQLYRTGQCFVNVAAADLYTTEEAKRSRRLENGEPADDTARVALRRAAAAEADHVFFLMRDLSHQHYHHHPHSDLLTRTYPADDDEVWRRQTLYGLVRLAIASRRKADAKSYKEALGVLAYAEAFQRHLFGWKFQRGEIRPASLKYRYDFGALRSSIEASLKVRELVDSTRKQTMLFCFATSITVLGLLVTGVRAEKYKASASDEGLGFLELVQLASNYPLRTLIVTVVAAWFFDSAVLAMAFRPHWLSGINGGLSRLLDSLAVEIDKITYSGVAHAASGMFGLVLATALLTAGVAGLWQALTVYWPF